MHFEIVEFGGGYRPTAAGRIDGLPFSFRGMLCRWQFLVAKESAKGDLWWHSPAEEIGFCASGRCPKSPWHTEAIDCLLDGLAQYLETRENDRETRENILQQARKAIQEHLRDQKQDAE